MNISNDMLQSFDSPDGAMSAFFRHELANKFLNSIDYQFKNKTLLFKSLCHQSFVNELPKIELGNYERLEFLGDSVLGLVITEEIFKRYPKEDEGSLSKLKSMLVNGRSFSVLAKKISLNEVVLLGRGELNQEGQLNQGILGDIFESFFGALYLDSGIDNCKKILKDIIKDEDEFYELGKVDLGNYKTRLQELTHSKLNTTPAYLSKKKTVNGVEGFEVNIQILEYDLIQVWNPSKKIAMNIAAKKVLQENLINTIIGDQNAH